MPPISASPSAASDKATLSLIRRTLCPSADKNTSQPLPLPSLTSRNDVDVQLYALIAIVVRDFVYAWYGRITPDQVFVAEIVRVLAHCVRALEERARGVDWEAVVWDELPELLGAHVRAYRAAHYPLHPPPYEEDPRRIYHALWPSPALSPVPDAKDPASVALQQENEAAYRELLVQGVLAVLLPTEDLENGCLMTLVGAILSDLIIGNGIGGKAAEPWMIWEGIIKITEVLQSQMAEGRAQGRGEGQTTDMGRKRTKEHGAETSGALTTLRWTVQKTFWLVLQYAFLAFTTIRLIILAISTASSLPARTSPSLKVSSPSPAGDGLHAPASPYSAKSSPTLPPKQPILAMKIWPCISDLLDLDIRMPWLHATISLLQWGALRGPGRLGATDGMIDKLLHTHLTLLPLRPTLLAPLLHTLRTSLFPHNMPGAPRTAPSAAGILALRRRCAEAVVGLVPAAVGGVYFGGGEGEERVGQVEEVVGVFGDGYLNRHLLYAVVETVVGRLVPEMRVGGG